MRTLSDLIGRLGPLFGISVLLILATGLYMGIAGHQSRLAERSTLMSPFASTLFYVGAALMLLDAALYSLGAIRPLREGIQAPTAYWDRRLLLNLLLANMGLYFTALFT